MKRVGGRVTWLLEFDGAMANLVARHVKRQTLRRCHIVEAGDTLRFSRGGDAGVFAEATCTRSRPITIGIGERDSRMTCWAELSGVEMTKGELDALAVADGFEGGARELVEWLEAHGKFFAGLYDGQLIEW